nr:unnamed protein product [Callosobruchus analis]
MYSFYLEDCEEKGRRDSQRDSDIFNYEYNYSFKSPDTETCDICDKCKIHFARGKVLRSASKNSPTKQISTPVNKPDDRWDD